MGGHLVSHVGRSHYDRAGGYVGLVRYAVAFDMESAVSGMGVPAEERFPGVLDVFRHDRAGGYAMEVCVGKSWPRDRSISCYRAERGAPWVPLGRERPRVRGESRWARAHFWPERSRVRSEMQCRARRIRCRVFR